MALGLTALVLAGLAWTTVVSIKQVEEVNRRNRRIDGLRGTIGRLDEVLTMSARMGAATGDPRVGDALPEHSSLSWREPSRRP